MFAHLWMELPELNNTLSAKTEVEVKNKVKHIKNIRKQATARNKSRSLLNYLHYSDPIKRLTLYHRSDDRCNPSNSRTMIQFAKRSSRMARFSRVLRSSLPFPREFCRETQRYTTNGKALGGFILTTRVLLDSQYSYIFGVVIRVTVIQLFI